MYMKLARSNPGLKNVDFYGQRLRLYSSTEPCSDNYVNGIHGRIIKFIYQTLKILHEGWKYRLVCSPRRNLPDCAEAMFGKEIWQTLRLMK
jgi:hypothetical protein